MGRDVDSAEQNAATPRRCWRPTSLPPLWDEEGWLCGTAFPDRLCWLPDADAARLLGERYRSGCLDVEELQIDLDQIAFLDPAEASACLDWLRAEVVPADWSYSFSDGSTVDWPQFINRMAGKVAAGGRIRDLAAAPLAERRMRLQQVRDLAVGVPEWWDGTREVILAEALADPGQAAEVALEFWCRQEASDSHGEREVARRLWLRDPLAALAFMERQERFHCESLLPILLQRTLIQPSAEHLQLVMELLARMGRCSWVTLCVAVVRVLHLLEFWEQEDRAILVEAAVQAVIRFDPVYDSVRPRYSQFRSELADHLSSLPLPAQCIGGLSTLLVEAPGGSGRRDQ